MAKKENKKIGVYVDITINAFIEVEAESLEDGLKVARSLKIEDMVTLDGQLNDSEIKINGVQE